MNISPESRFSPAVEALLASDADAIRAQAREAFDEFAEGRDVVIFGAGNLGRKLADAMNEAGAAPVAFADNAERMWGTAIAGIEVCSPATAARRFANAVFVIAIWGAGSSHRQAHTRAQLAALGITRVCSFPMLAWKYEGVLPHYLVDWPDVAVRASDSVRECLAMWSDERSRAEFEGQLRLRLTGSFDHLSHPDRYPQYLPDDLITWRDDEVIVDGGAFDGDTLRAWLQLRGDAFAAWIAIEPDAQNFERLHATVRALPASVSSKIRLHQSALGATAGTLPWDGQGVASATSQHDSEVHVHVQTISEILHQDQLAVTYLKLDIEGDEPKALVGARSVIERDRPVLAICVYHLSHHLWSIPLQMRAMVLDYDFFLRPHNEEGFDLICYGIPRERR